MAAEKYFKIPDDVAEFIRTAHPQLKNKIREALEIISDNPNAGKSLKNELERLKSFRISRFRIIYRVSSPRETEIIAIGHRENIYTDPILVLYGTEIAEVRKHAFLICLGIILSRK